MSKGKPNNGEALKIIRAEIKEAQRQATLAKRIIDREQDFVNKTELKIQSLKLAEAQLESAYE